MSLSLCGCEMLLRLCRCDLMGWYIHWYQGTTAVWTTSGCNLLPMLPIPTISICKIILFSMSIDFLLLTVLYKEHIVHVCKSTCALYYTKSAFVNWWLMESELIKLVINCTYLLFGSVYELFSKKIEVVFWAGQTHSSWITEAGINCRSAIRQMFATQWM